MQEKGVVFEYQMSCSLLDMRSFSQQPRLKAFPLVGGLSCTNGFSLLCFLCWKRKKKKGERLIEKDRSEQPKK